LSLALTLASGIVLLAAVTGCACALASAVLAGRFAGRTDSPPGARDWPAVSILKPLHGAEPGLEDNLRSFLAQDYPGEWQLILGLQDPADPAVHIANMLAAADSRVTVVIDPAELGANRKISNLINMARAARHEMLVQSDSDIRVQPGYLRSVACAAADPTIGLVTCLYTAVGIGGAWSRFAAMNVSYAFLPNVVFGVSLGLARPAMGSTLALRREVLERIGGFEAFADVLADDYEMGRAVRALGLRTRLTPCAVAHVSAEPSFAEVWRQELRWAVTIRTIDPAGFYGSVVTHPLPLGLIGTALAGGAWWSWAVVGCAIASRLWLKRRIDQIFDAHSGPWWWLPGRDLAGFCVFVYALFARSVEWRGFRYQVTGRGGLADARPPAVG
jgi:ceramide glucosyltransferase